MMFAAYKIFIQTQKILRNQVAVNGTAALQLNTMIPRPADQEVFAATPWKPETPVSLRSRIITTAFGCCTGWFIRIKIYV